MDNRVYLYYAYIFFRNCTLFASILVPFYVDWGHLDQVQIHLLQSWFGLWAFVFNIPTGILADRIGRKWCLIVGGLISALGVWIYASHADFQTFMVGEFVVALGMSMAQGADQAWVYDTLPSDWPVKQRSEVTGSIQSIAQSIGYMGLFVSAPLGGWLGSQISWEFPMQLTCIPILISCVFAGLLPEPSRMKQEKESIFISLKKGIGYLAHHAELRPLVIDAVTVAAAAYFVLWLYQPLLLKYGIGGELLSLFYILMLAAEIIVSTLNTWIAKKIGFMRFRILTSILVAVGFLIATLGGVISIYVFLVLTGGIGLTRFMFMCSYMQEHIPEENRATIGSTIQVARQMLIAVLNPIMGWLFIQSNSITMIALALIALMPVWIMIGRRSR